MARKEKSYQVIDPELLPLFTTVSHICLATKDRAFSKLPLPMKTDPLATQFETVLRLPK